MEKPFQPKAMLISCTLNKRIGGVETSDGNGLRFFSIN